MDQDTAIGIAAELRHFLKEGWKATYDSERFTIAPPKSHMLEADPDGALADEVWRVARQVAYRNFVSIAQSPDGSYTIISNRKSGGGFVIKFLAGSN